MNFEDFYRNNVSKIYAIWIIIAALTTQTLSIIGISELIELFDYRSIRYKEYMLGSLINTFILIVPRIALIACYVTPIIGLGFIISWIISSIK